ncbi:receptor-type tyrosine-protein phosphatase alpha-like isoform X2 [Ostrea edulis]|uniref:receptor-type tyrosine-protein phosphatase alpha-like isoform X2 n=1 Tax=Ostrea edulis TaxID=37623 RepID=UPI0024AF09DF|nr:receptor-type tyrosine-protein phosphatase alpha-like isoform X2 [Ostrea edulis]
MDVLMIIFFVEILCSYGYDDLSKGQNANQFPIRICEPLSICAANNAVDRISSTCMTTKKIGLNSPEKTTWWFVNLGDVYSIYSVRILFKEHGPTYVMRQRGRLAGFSIYLSMPSTKRDEFLCHKDEPPGLPPLDFNTTCIGYSQYFMFYNERLDGVTYDGYESPTFTELCEVIVEGCKKPGVYGSNCNLTCPVTCKEQRCNIVNGTCFHCMPGWMGAFCENKCPARWYGDRCQFQCVGHCKENASCTHVTGGCDNGCAEGWTGAQCEIPCENGRFGTNCSNVCSEKCIDVCRHTDGVCNCSPGYMGFSCIKECDGSYGINCQHECSNNCINNTCDKINGSCTSGCKASFRGTKCDQGTSSASLVSDDPSSDTLVVGGAVGGISILIVLAVLTVLFLRLRRKSSRSAVKENLIRNPTFSSMELKPNESRLKPINNQQDKNVNDVKPPVNDVIETVKRGRPTNTTIPVKNLQAIIDKMSLGEHAGFKHEYHEIPKGELHPCEEAKKPENKPKNRYKTTFSYDHSRVILKTTTTNGGDYINANYMEDAEGKRSYIATQGPKPKTIADFWRMIWQEGVSIIVCLTNLKEGSKNKCAPYWPDINDKIQDGDLNIRNLREKDYANCTIRQFKFYNGKEHKDREVVIFHYTRWPDHGVPDPLSLVIFHRHVMKTSSSYSGKCTVVHCSAGIGRTGTYIALDALYREGCRKGRINVPMYVRTMRKDRMNMIQGDDQYKTVYLALFESFRGKSRCLTTEQFLQECGGESCYANAGDITMKSPKCSEFEELLSLRKEYLQKDYESGRANITANYTNSVLPVDRFMCRLCYSKERSTYYNAVLHQTFTANDLLISAQYPLPDYTEDFLRLVKEFDARVVVFMCPLKGLKSSPLWFPSKNNTKTVGNFTVRLTTLTNSDNVSTTKIILDCKGGSEKQITVLECKAWKDGEAAVNKRPLLDVIKEAKSEKPNQEGRILILSSDGATRCGPFCVVYNALEQIAMDKEVDIFTIARQFQVRRTEFLSTLDEYQLCHDVVAEYLQNDGVYANC